MFNELLRRRVPHVLGLYLAAGWGVLEFTDWLTNRYGFSPHLADLGLLTWALMIPTVLILAYTHGAAGGQGWGPIEKYAIPLNIAVAVAVIGLRVSTIQGSGWSLKPSTETYEATRLAVLYFEDDSEGQELGHLASAFTGALIDELSQVAALDVVPRAAVKPYQGIYVTLDSLARALQIGTLVEGSVSGAKERLNVGVTLVDPAAQTSLGSFDLDGTLEEWEDLRDDLAAEVARLLRQQLGSEVRLRERRAHTESDAALALVERAEQLRAEARKLRRMGDISGLKRTYTRADSLLAEAESLDARWVEPIVQRGWWASDMAGLSSLIPGSFATGEMMTALFHAERAVTLAPDDASALELRGSLRFEVSRNDKLTEPAELRAAAERDLSAAVAADPFRAEAWRDLSELNRVEGRFAEAKGNAERALEADPFLSEDRDVIFTLYQSSQELGDMDETVRWCAEGHRRFPDDYGFVACSLFVLALSRGPAPDVSRAWALLDTLVQTTRPQGRDTNRRIGETWVAAVLARAGSEDSARSVLRRARDTASGDIKPWLDYTGANVMLLLGDRQQALALLDSFLEAVPQRRQYIASDWMFEDLWDDPRFKELVAAEQ